MKSFVRITELIALQKNLLRKKGYFIKQGYLLKAWVRTRNSNIRSSFLRKPFLSGVNFSNCQMQNSNTKAETSCPIILVHRKAEKSLSLTLPLRILGNLSQLSFNVLNMKHFILRFASTNTPVSVSKFTTQDLEVMNNRLYEENCYLEEELSYFTVFIEKQKDEIELLKHKLRFVNHHLA